MREKNAPGDTGSVYMRTSSVARLNLQFRETDSTCQDHSCDTSSSADLARVADRVQTSRRNRRTRLMILNRFL
eukprot:2961530-Pyramimonas_sp.AAC.1